MDGKRILLFVLILACGVMSSTVPARAAFGFYRVIYINPAKVPASQTNFTVMFAGTYSYLATVANGGKVQNANGYDVGFYTNSNCSTGKLNWETELYTATTGAVRYWVLIPTLTNVTQFYLCYGDSSISTDQSNATAAWDSNTIAWYHLPDGSTLTALDSTSNNLDGTLSGMTPPDAAAGPGNTDGAANFDGTTSYIDLGTSATWGLTGEMTACAWMNSDASTGDKQIIIGNVNAATTATPWILYISNDPRIGYTHISPPDPTVAEIANTTLSYATWYHVCWVRTGSAGSWTVTYYLNGANDGSDTFASNPANNFTTVMGRDGAGAIQHFDGKMDEVNVSNTPRSANWILTQYRNQNSPSTFYYLGNEHAVGTSAGSYGWRGTFTVTSNSALLPATQTNYPLLVSVTNNALKTVANGGEVEVTCAAPVVTGPCDMGFYSDIGLSTTILRWEVESYNASTGALTAWVQIPSLSLGLAFYAGVGNADILFFQGGDVGQAWDSNFVAVYHLRETGTGSAGDYKDSTSGAYNSTNTANQPAAVAGKIGTAQDFNGTTELIDTSDIAAMDSLTTFTISCWVNLDDAANTNDTVAGKFGATGLFLQTGGSGGAGDLSYGFNSGSFVQTNTGPLASTTWQYWTGTFNTGTTPRHAMYINAVLQTNVDSGTPDTVASTGASAANFQIGKNNALNRYMAGLIDECRASNVARSANWTTVDYNSMNDPGTFVTAAFAAISAGTKVIGGGVCNGGIC